MSTSDKIFLYTGLPLEQVAERLRVEMGLRKVVDDNSRIFLVRDLPGQPAIEVGGEIEENPFFPEADPEPHEISVIDGYDISWDVGTVARDEEILHAATRELFGELITAAPSWPALLVLQVDTLLAASRPGIGVVEFPPNTSPDGDDRDLWRPFDIFGDAPRVR